MRMHNVKKALWSFSLVLFIFSVFLLLFNPVMNSDDDFYFLYTLAGGYGDAPSNLLHYDYTLNPVLTWPIAKLFSLYPSFNWYSLFLLSIHFICCSFLAYIFYSLYNFFYSTFLFLVFFLFIESRLMLSLNYSNACLIAALAGFTGLFFYFIEFPGKKVVSRKILFFSCLLIILAGLLRFHVTGLCGLFFVMAGLLFMPVSKYKAFFKTLLLTMTIALVFMLGHKFYYQEKIPNWRQEEKYRQSMFAIYNTPLIGKGVKSLQIKNQFIRSSFLYDTSYIGINDIKSFYNNFSHKHTWQQINDSKALYWMFRSLRVYLLLLAGLIILLLLAKNNRNLLKWIVLLVFSVFILGYLLIFLKITETIFLALYSGLFITGVFFLPKPSIRKSIVQTGTYIIVVLSSFWMIVLLIKMNKGNEKGIQDLRCFLKEFGNHRDKLFISVDNKIPVRKFAIWDYPAEYPVVNLLNKEIALNFGVNKILKKYSIDNIFKELPIAENLFILGNGYDYISGYYTTQKQVPVIISSVPGFICLSVYKITPGN